MTTKAKLLSGLSASLDQTGKVPSSNMGDSIALTGTPSSPTAAAGTNTTQLATTAFVFTAVPVASSTNPTALGVAAVGVGTTFARADHVHLIPTLATLGAQAAGTYATGTGSASGTNTGDQALPVASSTNPAALGVAAVGVGTTFARADHVHLIPTLATLGAQASGTYATGTGSASGTNTGDETLATVKTKLGITTLSGSNTGDQTLPTALPNANAITFNSTGGAAAGSTYTGAAILTVDYSTVGAAPSGHTHSYQAADNDLLAIGGLTGTSGYLKKTAADTWTLDTSSFAPLTGTGTSGTWPISVSGSSTSTPLMSIDNSIAYGRSGLQFIQISAAAGNVATTTNAPTADWWHIIRSNHANATGYYTDLALPMTAATNIRYRRIAAGVSSGWITVWDSTNLTNLNQLINGPGYISGYTETDTLATVTARGATTALKVSIGSGIAQGAPSATDVTANATLLLSGNGGNYLAFGQHTTGQAQWIQSSYSNPTTAVYPIALQPLGGLVGIGTYGPTQRLHVVGNILAAASGDTYIASSKSGVTTSYLITDSSGANLAVDGAWPIRFTTNGAERARIDSGGNLLLTGGFVPTNTSRLVVRGFSSASYGNNFAQANSTAQIISSEMDVNQWYPTLNITMVRQSLTTGNGGFGGIGFSTIDDSNNNGMYDAGRIAIVNESPSVVASPAAMAFYTQVGSVTATNAATEKMRIDSAGNVGIGTTTPAVKLDIAGAGTAVTQLIWARGNDDASFVSSLRTGDAGATGAQSTIGVDYAGFTDFSRIKFHRASTNGEIHFYTGTAYANGTEKMRLMSSGNLGIGTTAPTSKLTVSYVSNGTGPLDPAKAGLNLWGDSSVRLLFGTYTASPYAAYIQTSNTGSAFPLALNPSGGYVGIGTNNPAQKLSISQDGSVNNQYIQLLDTQVGGHAWNLANNASNIIGAFGLYDATAGAYRLIIDASGNLGVAATPAAWDTNYKSITVRNMSLSDLGVSTNMYYNAGYKFASTGAAAMYSPLNGAHAWFSAGSGTVGTTIGFTQAMTLDSSNNLGIGTTSPLERLQVTNGNISIYNPLSTTNYVKFVSGYANNVTSYIAGANGPNWGGHLLSWVGRPGGGSGAQYGTVQSVYDDPTVGYPNQNTHLSVNVLSTTANNLGILYVGTGSIATNTRTGLYVETGAVLAATTGNVGIGTATPSTKLHITGIGGGGYSTTNKITLQRTDAANPTGSIQFQGSGGNVNPYWNILTDADITNDFGIAYNGSKYLQVLINGNVGIGTTAPSAPLHIIKSGGSTTTPNLALILDYESDTTSLAGGGTAIEFRGKSGSGNLANYSQARIRSVTYEGNNSHGIALDYKPSAAGALTEGLRITDGGSVGIGTTAPAYKLDVVGSGRFAPPMGGDNGFFVTSAATSVNHYFDVQLAPGGGAYNYLRFKVAGNDIFTWGNTQSAYADLMTLSSPAGAFRVSTNGTERMRILSSGNVGIGTTAPDTKLHITATSAITSQDLLTLDGSATGFSGTNDVGTGYSIVFNACGYSAIASIVQRTGAAIQMLKSNSWNEAGGGGTKASLVFKTNNGTIATPDLTERMRIDSAGNALIGLSTALANGKLQVAGSIGLSGNTQIRQATNGDGNSLQVWATQVLAGTSNSTTYSYTDGSLLASVSNGDGALLLDVGRGTSTYARFKIVNSTGSNALLSFGKSTLTTLYADTSNGQVGIGTTTPLAPLHVFYAPATNASVDDVVRITSKYNAATGASAVAGSGPAIVFSGGIGDNQTRDRARIVAVYEASNMSGLAFHTQSTADIVTERMRIDINGRVGIGTTVPTGRLTVVSDASTAGGGVSSWNTSYSVFGPNAGSTTGAAFAIGYNNTNDRSEILSLSPSIAWKPISIFSAGVKFTSNAGTEAVRIETVNGTVGAISMALRLSTNAGTANGMIVAMGLGVQNDGFSKGGIGWVRGTGGSDTGNLTFYNNSTNDASNFGTADERMRVTSAGLTVTGTIIATGDITVASGIGASNIYMSDSDEGTRQIHCNSNRIGFLTQAGGWGSYCDDSGNWSSVGTVTGSNLSGTNTGDQTNITGTAGAATLLNSSHLIARVGSSGNWNTDFTNTAAGNTRLSGDISDQINNPGNVWWFMQNMRHSNASNVWGTQVAWGWEDNANRLATRNITSGTYGAWVYYLNSSNYSSYALPLTGGALTGNLSFSQPSALVFANGQLIKDNGGGGLLISSGAAINLTGTTIAVTGAITASSTITATGIVSANGLITSDQGVARFGSWTSIQENGFYDAAGNFLHNAVKTSGADDTWNYRHTAAAGRYRLSQNVHSWYTAPSGTAGTAISFTQAMTLSSSGLAVAGGIALGDNKLFLRGMNDTNHYLWNAADDWEEIVAYSGTGFRLVSSTGTSLINMPGAGGGTFNGNANTVTNATFYRQFTVRDDRSDGGDYSLISRPTGLYAITGAGTNGPGSNYSGLIHVANGGDVAFQIAGGYNADNMYFRGTYALQYGTGYSPWRTVIHNGNYNSYAPTLTGTGASGTWGINVTGNAGSASNITNSGTVTLATATESNSIYITAPSYATDTPVKLLNFDWYSNIFSIGNIRSGGAGTNGFGVYYTTGGVRAEIARFSTAGSFTASGNVTAYSDRRIKTNIQVIPDALAKVRKLNGYTFDRTDIDLPRQTGVIAQELLEVLPEAVTGSEENHYAVAYGNMAGLFIEAIKEQQGIIDSQEERIARLEALVSQLIEG